MEHIDTIVAKYASETGGPEGRLDILKTAQGYDVFDNELGLYLETGLGNKRDAYRLTRRAARRFDVREQQARLRAAKRAQIKPATTFTLEAGRCILRNGVPMFTIGRCERCAPTDADEMAHRIVRLLQADEDAK